MLKVTSKVTLNLNKLERAWEQKRRRVLYRTAGYTLKVFIRQPIRSRKKSTKAPANPTSKTKAFKRNTRFDVDARRGTADIGFTRFPSAVARPLGGKTVPEVLLGGGRERITSTARTITRPDGRVRNLAPRTVTATYRPRPALLRDATTKGGEKLLENCRQVGL